MAGRPRVTQTRSSHAHLNTHGGVGLSVHHLSVGMDFEELACHVLGFFPLWPLTAVRTLALAWEQVIEFVLQAPPFSTYFWLFTMCTSVFGYLQCFGAILLLLSVTYALCKALSWKSLWIKASAKWINVNVTPLPSQRTWARLWCWGGLGGWGLKGNPIKGLWNAAFASSLTIRSELWNTNNWRLRLLLLAFIML